jgi:hypothetical protein
MQKGPSSLETSEKILPCERGETNSDLAHKKLALPSGEPKKACHRRLKVENSKKKMGKKEANFKEGNQFQRGKHQTSPSVGGKPGGPESAGVFSSS